MATGVNPSFDAPFSGTAPPAPASTSSVGSIGSPPWDVNQQQIDLAREFAKNGIQWRVEDAKKAGLHPLYALGAGATASPPQLLGGGDYRSGTLPAQPGQSPWQQMAATLLPSMFQFLASTAATNSKLVDMALPGQFTDPMGSLGLVQNQPVRRSATVPGQPGIQAGHGPTAKYQVKPDGGLGLLPSDYAKEAAEDQFIPEAMLGFDIYGRSNFDPDLYRPDKKFYPLPKGYSWVWDFQRQGYYAKSRGGRVLDVLKLYPGFKVGKFLFNYGKEALKGGD